MGYCLIVVSYHGLLCGSSKKAYTRHRWSRAYKQNDVGGSHLDWIPVASMQVVIRPSVKAPRSYRRLPFLSIRPARDPMLVMEEPNTVIRRLSLPRDITYTEYGDE